MCHPYPIIHINGFPGTGKLTIATHLISLLPGKAKLVHNHLLINPADAILMRDQPGYQDLRHSIRSAVFSSLVQQPATFETAYIFTDFQSNDPVGTAVCKEFEDMARRRGSCFVPIVLSCDEATNLERLVSVDRTRHAKLTNVELVKRFRQNVEIHRFLVPNKGMDLDVSGMEAEEAAKQILEHLLKVCPDLRSD